MTDKKIVHLSPRRRAPKKQPARLDNMIATLQRLRHQHGNLLVVKDIEVDLEPFDLEHLEVVFDDDSDEEILVFP